MRPLPVCVITGASEGIGLHTAREFLMQGYRVVMAARDLSKAHTWLSKVPDRDKVLAIPTDITDTAQCERLIVRTLETFGQIDVLVLNASITHRSLFAETPIEVQKQVFEVNYWGNLRVLQLAIPALAHSRGVVVAVTGTSAKVPLPGRNAYCASKYAQEGFFETLRTEVRKHGIAVTVVRPTYTATNIRRNALLADGSRQGETSLDEGKLHTPGFVAEKIYRAADKRLRYYNLGLGNGTLPIILYKLFPTWMDKIMAKRINAEKNAPFQV